MFYGTGLVIETTVIAILPVVPRTVGYDDRLGISAHNEIGMQWRVGGC